jgi:hypothetical protein
MFEMPKLWTRLLSGSPARRRFEPFPGGAFPDGEPVTEGLNSGNAEPPFRGWSVALSSQSRRTNVPSSRQRDYIIVNSVHFRPLIQLSLFPRT